MNAALSDKVPLDLGRRLCVFGRAIAPGLSMTNGIVSRDQKSPRTTGSLPSLGLIVQLRFLAFPKEICLQSFGQTIHIRGALFFSAVEGEVQPRYPARNLVRIGVPHQHRKNGFGLAFGFIDLPGTNI
ncbi:MAG: hypothetical protein AAFY34_16120 [Pseudomonadota bacterium]